MVEELSHLKRVLLNGQEIPLISTGKWIGICFDELKIPDEYFVSGRNVITVEMEYYKTSGIEAVYLLGDFGVTLRENKAVLTTLPETLKIGDITSQGLPFYSGAVRYLAENLGQEMVNVQIKQYGGSLVKLLGETEKIAAFPPYREDVKGLKWIEVVLNRRNTFGPFHLYPMKAASYGPRTFMTQGDQWRDEYLLYPQGLLEKPVIRQYRQKGQE